MGVPLCIMQLSVATLSASTSYTAQAPALRSRTIMGIPRCIMQLPRATLSASASYAVWAPAKGLFKSKVFRQLFQPLVSTYVGQLSSNATKLTHHVILQCLMSL